jgi:hypothetical protein
MRASQFLGIRRLHEHRAAETNASGGARRGCSEARPDGRGDSSREELATIQTSVHARLLRRLVVDDRVGES